MHFLRRKAEIFYSSTDYRESIEPRFAKENMGIPKLFGFMDRRGLKRPINIDKTIETWKR